MPPSLNPQQLQAVSQVDGPLLILAGAGSGKTHTLTQRVVYMCTKLGISAGSIFCVTFTNKAAGEMRKRIMEELKVEGDPRKMAFSMRVPLVATFHSAGVFLLRQFIERLGYGRNFGIYDDSDSIALVKEIMKERKLYDEDNQKRNGPREIRYHISHAKEADLSPAAFAQSAQKDSERIAAQVYPEYEKRLKGANALDFDDILRRTVEVLRIPEVLAQVQSRFQYFCVDEYQDTNGLQYEMVQLLASATRNLCVVGDDWQGIYGWRGADIRNILNFKSDYPNAVVIKLEQNYRSTKNIIHAANTLIKKNRSAMDKTLWTDNAEGDLIKIYEMDDDRAEATKVAKIIRDVAGPLNRWAVLYRTNGQSRTLEEALISSGLPYRIFGGLRFYDRLEVKDLMSYLRLLANPYDAAAFVRIVNVPGRKIGAKTVEILTAFAREKGLDYISVGASLDYCEDLRGAAKTALDGFYELIKELKELMPASSPRQLLADIIRKTDYEEWLKRDHSMAEVEGKMDNLKELQNLASQYEGFSPEEGLRQFLEGVALMTDQDRDTPDGDDYVSLMTAHSAKGLEFENVIVTGMEENLFPHTRALVDHEELEEERRLAYVAVTRAKRRLFLLRARERFSFGNYNSNPASRFLKELPTECVEVIEDKPVRNMQDLFSSFSGSGSKERFSGFGGAISGAVPGAVPPSKRSRNTASDFSLGDRVAHDVFGEGTIVSISGAVAQVAFFGKGIKTLNIELAPIKKV